MCGWHHLQNHSVEGLQFLEEFGVNLSAVVRLGGHTFPRTRSNPTGKPQQPYR